MLLHKGEFIQQLPEVLKGKEGYGEFMGLRIFDLVLDLIDEKTEEWLLDFCIVLQVEELEQLKDIIPTLSGALNWVILAGTGIRLANRNKKPDSYQLCFFPEEHTGTFYKFKSNEEPTKVKGNPVLLVENPVEVNDFDWLLNKYVEINNYMYKAIGIEKFAHSPPFKIGEKIGIMVGSID